MTFLGKIKVKIKTKYKNFGDNKVFCISMQRNGTTSVGHFLKEHGYEVAGYGSHSVEWSELWEKGDYESIFQSPQFKNCQAFEDNPWWFPDFYRVLNFRFPNAKFILFYRDSDKWFDSMIAHEKIKYLSQNYRHCKVYNRLEDYYHRLEKPYTEIQKYCPNIEQEFISKRKHYNKIYNLFNREVITYFSKYAPHKLVHCDLEDQEKWIKVGNFLGLNVKVGYEVKKNSTVN